MISIIIPCYNHAKYLSEAIISAVTQTISPLEVIVVNDGSTDNTSEVFYQTKDRLSQLEHDVDLILIEQENKGLPSARNTGIAKAKGEWIISLDADDILDSTYIEKCLSLTEDAEIIGTGQEEFGDSQNKRLFEPEIPHERFKTGNRINCSAMFKKEIWEKIGGYDETMTKGYEDWDFWYRATKQGYKVKTIQEYLLKYRKHGESLVSIATRHHEEIMNYILNK